MPPRKKKGPAKGHDDQGWVFLGKTGADRPAEPNDEADDISMEEIEAAFRDQPELLEQLKAVTEKALAEFVEKHGRPPTEEEFIAELGLDEDDDAENFLDGLFDDIDDDDLEPFPQNADEEEEEDDDDADDGKGAEGKDEAPPTTGRGRRR